MPGSQSGKHTDKSHSQTATQTCPFHFPRASERAWGERAINGDRKMWGGVRKKKWTRKKKGSERKAMIVFHFLSYTSPYSFSHSLAASFPSRAFRNEGLQRKLPIVKVNVMPDGRQSCHMRNVELANKLNQTQSNHLCCATGPILSFPEREFILPKQIILWSFRRNYFLSSGIQVMLNDLHLLCIQCI